MRVLSISTNLSLSVTRQMLLEAAGHQVVTVLNIANLPSACLANSFDVALLCQSLAPLDIVNVSEILARLCSKIRIVKVASHGIEPLSLIEAVGGDAGSQVAGSQVAYQM